MGINEEIYFFFSDVLKIYNLFLVYKTNVLLKLLKLMINYTLICLFFPLIRVTCGFISLVSRRKHFLCALLRLEFIMLRIFWSMCIYRNRFGKEIYLVLFFLVLVACEGALGLSILVAIVRSHGNDCFSSFRILQC